MFQLGEAHQYPGFERLQIGLYRLHVCLGGDIVVDCVKNLGRDMLGSIACDPAFFGRARVSRSVT
jgi:hypothetical protein